MPKLLDFGIATLLEAEGGAAIGTTRTGHSSFTPEFASPEQVRGDRVTTSSDIYSLGVLLYVLLTGRRPYELAGLPPLDAMRAICDVEPPRPSAAAEPSLAGALRGDLDNIIARALRKVPAERYATVAAFADDLRAWRDGRPVSAVPASMAYLARRFVRRNRLAVATAAAVAAAVLGGGTVAVWQARIARAEKASAEARFNDVRSLANTVVGPLYDAIAALPGSTSARQLLVAEALAYLDRLAALSANDLDLKAELAEAYQKIGDVQGNHLDANLGDVQAAKASYGKLLTLREAVFAARPDEASRRELARAELLLGDVALGEYHLDDAVARYGRVLDLVGPAMAATPDEATALMAARAHGRSGVALGWAGRTQEAAAGFDRAIALLEARLARADASRRCIRAWPGCSTTRATSTTTRNSSIRRSPGTNALSAWRASRGRHAAERRAATVVAGAHSHGGRAQGGGAPAGRVDTRNRDHCVARSFDRARPERRQRAVRPGNDRQNLAITYMRRGELVPARRQATAALALFESTMAASPGSRQFRFDFAATWTTLGQIELADRRFAASADAFRASIDLFRDPQVPNGNRRSGCSRTRAWVMH